MASSPRRVITVLPVLLFTGLLSWWRIRLLGDVRQQLGTFYGWFAVAFIAYLAALWVLHRSTHDQPTGQRTSWWAMGCILIGAVAFRALLIGTTPTLSDDIHRYVWDGRVQQAGFEPYIYPPADEALRSLRDEAFASINFPHLRTIYQPLAEAAFRLGAGIAPTLTAQKLVFVGAELLTVIALLLVLAARHLSLLWVLAYAWHPLVVLEIAGSGHNDALGIAFLWVGLAAWQYRWRGTSALAWAASFLSKFLAVILVPWWWARRHERRWLPAFLLVAAAPLLLQPAMLLALWESLSKMSGARAESNASGYLLVAWLLGHTAWARWAAIGLWATFLLWWARRTADPVRYVFGGFLAAVLLSPAVHPWYLLWLVPFVCLWRVPAVIALTGTVVLSYVEWASFLAHGVWEVPFWARALEYAPVGLLAVWGLRRWSWGSSFLPATKPKRLAAS